MGDRTFQTTRLAAGRHATPEQGACVMELASMLAGEPFSDHPRAGCDVVGAFLRTYNDRVDDDRRQDLYEYAAKVVGSRAGRRVRRERGALLRAWAHERGSRISPRGWLVRPMMAAREAAAVAIARGDERTHREALRLLDELLLIGGPRSMVPSHPPKPGAVIERGKHRSAGIG